jgi:hypothetical protein
MPARGCCAPRPLPLPQKEMYVASVATNASPKSPWRSTLFDSQKYSLASTPLLGRGPFTAFSTFFQIWEVIKSHLIIPIRLAVPLEVFRHLPLLDPGNIHLSARHLDLSMSNATLVRFKVERIVTSAGTQHTVHIPDHDPTSLAWRGTVIRPKAPRKLTTLLFYSALAPVLQIMMVSSTTLLATVVGLLLTPAFSALGALHVPTNPVEGHSETASYDTSPATNHFNLMPGGDVAGTVPGFNAGASTSFHPRRVDPPYHAIVPSHVFDDRYGITH